MLKIISAKRENCRKNNKGLGFTLAEVLITLVIIGVIAALTIYSLQKRLGIQYVIQLEKMYSVLAQAAELAVSNEGSMEGWEVESNDGDNLNEHFTKTYILPYVINAKDCGDVTNAECDFVYKYPKDRVTHYRRNGVYKIILNDGSTVAFLAQKDASGSRVYAYADVNGSRGPNIFGKDLYTFVYWINTNSDYPKVFEMYGINQTREQLLNGNCNKTQTGEVCGAVLMKDSWSIKPDYPFL